MIPGVVNAKGARPALTVDGVNVFKRHGVVGEGAVTPQTLDPTKTRNSASQSNSAHNMEARLSVPTLTDGLAPGVFTRVHSYFASPGVKMKSSEVPRG